MTGEIEQRVPAYSAVKVGGERLYRKARRGEDVEAPVRRVVIETLELTRFDAAAQEAELEVRCSSGTYVRQLVADLGELCGAGAYCTALERTEVGPFLLADADDRAAAAAVGCSALAARAVLTEAEADDVRHGRRLAGTGGPGIEGEFVRLDLRWRRWWQSASAAATSSSLSPSSPEARVRWCAVAPLTAAMCRATGLLGVLCALLCALSVDAHAELVGEFNARLTDVKRSYGAYTVVADARAYETSGAPPPILTPGGRALPARRIACAPRSCATSSTATVCG